MIHIYILLIVLLLGCSSIQRNCVISNTDIQEQNIDTTFSLKNGYLLHKFTENDSILIYSLEKNDSRKAIIKQKDLKMNQGSI